MWGSVCDGSASMCSRYENPMLVFWRCARSSVNWSWWSGVWFVTKMRLGPMTSRAEKLLMRIGICPADRVLAGVETDYIREGKTLTKGERRVV